MPRIDADGVELFYESLGEGTPLVLLATTTRHGCSFRPGYFSQSYRFITFDRRGTGRSASPDGPWTIADFARDVRALLDALQIERAIVGGSSLGGVISRNSAVDYPDRALALIVGHTVPYLWDLGKQWLLDLMDDAQPTLGDQPRSYEWEPRGPADHQSGVCRLADGPLGELGRTGLGRDMAAVAKMYAAMLDWDQRPRYPELKLCGCRAWW